MPDVTAPSAIAESSDVDHDQTSGGTDGNPHASSASTNHGNGNHSVNYFAASDYTPEADTHNEQHTSDQHNGDSLHNIGVGIPVYQSTSDVPSVPEGTLVYIQSDNSIYVEDGT